VSKKVYCIAQFLPKVGKHDELFEVLKSLEPNTLREDGCIQYTLTQQIKNAEYSSGKLFPIVFNEVWADMASYEAHCQRREIQEFFQKHCVAKTGLVADHNVCIYTDEPNNYDSPIFEQ